MTALDYAALNAKIDRELPGHSFVNLCEQFRFVATRMSNGLASNQMQPSSSAKIARGKATIIDKNRAAATAGQVGFWDKTKFEHDMLSLGNDFWIGATGLGDTVVDLGGGLKILTGASYPAPFLGRADKVGSNPKALLLPYSPPPRPAPATGGNPTVITHALSGRNWNFAPPSPEIQKRIQVALAKRGRYSGKLNGIWGNLSVSAIQATAANVAPPAWRRQYIPGVPGYNLCVYLQAYAAKFGGFVGLKPGGGATKGIMGPNAWLAVARGLEAGLR